MKSFLLVGLLISIISIGCQKENEVSFLDNGTYLGTFQRELIWAEGDMANIIIAFSSNTWSGSSDRAKYPALCNGTYSIQGDLIIFENDCEWTAEFDWSLILSGEYKLITNGNNLEFYRDYRSATTDTFVDRYKLVKQ